MSSCPDCGAAAPAGASLCPACGFPLVLHARADAGSAAPLDLLRKPGEPGGPAPREPRTAPRAAGPRTAPMPVQVRQPAGGPPCGQCGHVSAATRIRCERCGAPLRAVELPWTGPATPQPVAVRPRRRWPLVAAAVAVVLVAGAGTGYLLANREEAPPAQPGDAVVGGDDAPQPVKIPSSAITAKASSTKSPERAYGVANTLDGKPGTAWNHDGKRDGTGKGTTITYTFDRPRHVVAITLVNGYAESKRMAKVWEANGRLKRVVVRTDEGTHDWALPDTVRPQTLTQDLGTTTKVTLDVRSIYPGDRFPDLALTEIAFEELPS